MANRNAGVLYNIKCQVNGHFSNYKTIQPPTLRVPESLHHHHHYHLKLYIERLWFSLFTLFYFNSSDSKDLNFISL